MDSNINKKRERNPREDANWLSFITTFFVLKIFRKGLHRDIQEDDIYEIVTHLRSDILGNFLEKEWEIELDKRKTWLLRPLFIIFWKQYAVLGISHMIMHTGLLITYPIFTGKLVSYFIPGQSEVSLNDAMLYTAGIIGAIFLYRIFLNIYIIFILELTMKIKTATCALIYRKCLKLNQTSLQTCSSGLVVTLITKDVQQFDYPVDMLLLMVGGIFQVIIMTYMMYSEIGVAAIYGTSLLLVLLPVQGCTGPQRFCKKKQINYNGSCKCMDQLTCANKSNIYFSFATENSLTMRGVMTK